MLGYMFKDDKRFHYAEEYLQDQGYTFAQDLSAPENLDFIVFPFFGKVDTTEYDSLFFSRLKKEAVLFSGVFNEYVAGQCQAGGWPYYPIMNDEAVKAKNAIPTSEGVIAHLIYNRNKTIFGSSILIAGYGIVGSNLAEKLQALGAKVYALVRSSVKESYAYRQGIIPVYLQDIGKLQFDVVVNTIPAAVFDKSMLDQLKGAMMVEIASPPYGFSMEYARTLNPDSVLLPGIPGKLAVKSAGRILGQYIDQKLKLS